MELDNIKMWESLMKYSTLPGNYHLQRQIEQSLRDQGLHYNSDTKKIESIEQKPAWSEEDEKILDGVITNYESGYLPSVEKRDEIIKKLESFKERHTWKPSDAQMASITCAVRKMKESACYDSELVSLFNDLKKLREE